MSINPKIAARIAREAGLSLSDARAIAAMADTEADAQELADQFRPDPSEDRSLSEIVDEIREWA